MTDNMDGWNNVLTNIGQQTKNRSSNTKYNPDRMIDRASLTSMYRGDGLARRVVDIPVDDAMREWIEADGKALDELARIDAKQRITEAAKWGRLYGGAVLVALIDDGKTFEEPVNMAGIRRVLQLRVYDRHRVSWTTADIQNDPLQANFGFPDYYTVQPIHGAPYRVHVSRLQILDGMPLPEDERQRNNGWGDSSLQSVYDALSKYGTVMGASGEIVQDFVQTVLGVKGLTDMLRAGEDDLVAKRATIIDLTRSVANTIFLDADGETYDKKASSVAGLSELWDRFAMHVSTVTGIPATKLLGRSPAGLNATGDSDIRQWYDVVGAYRGDELGPVVSWLVELLDAQLDWKKADRPDSMEWRWPSLWQPTEAEWADIKLKNAQTDNVYIMAGAVDAAYLYHLRHGGAEYCPDITYSLEEYEEWLNGKAGGE